MDSTSVCSIHDFPYNTHNKKSNLQDVATIRERLTCRHAVAKVWLLFKGSFYTRRHSMLLLVNTITTYIPAPQQIH